MKEMTTEELQAQYDLHLRIIDKYLSPERAVAVKNMIESIGEEYLIAPAAGTSFYHGCYPGGYLHHVNNVVKFALKIKKVYESLEGTVDFTDEELVFCALFHDLGKTGNGEKPNYIPQTNDWWKNKGKFYENNPEIDFMLIPQRSLYILQKFGIQVNQKEYLAILLHDGLFEETNKPYYISYNPDSRLRSNIVPILHSADFLASRQEFDSEQKDTK